MGDARMSDGRGQEYLDENFCSHEDLYVNDITVKVQSQPVGDLDNWKRYLQTVGTHLFTLYAVVVCEKCGASQEQHIDIDTILETKTWEWEE